MTQATHTPAPWEVKRPKGNELGVRDKGGFILFMTPVHRYENQEDRYISESAERLANAHLIAAAPDLLDFAEKFVKKCEEVGIKDYNTPLFPMAKSIIKKAKGL